MYTQAIRNLAEEWKDMTSALLHAQEPDFEDLQRVFSTAYQILFAWKGEEMIPKDVSGVLLQMEEFFYFLSIIGENEELNIYAHYQNLFQIAKTLRDDFLHDSFEAAYPILCVKGCGERVTFDFQQDRLQDFLEALSEEHK